MDSEKLQQARCRGTTMMNSDQLAVMQAEIDRLGSLLKEEQNAHSQTKSQAELDLQNLELKLKNDHENHVKSIISHHTEQSRSQQEEFNRNQSNSTEDTLRITKQLEDELADNQIAFEHFQAQSRRKFEEEFAEKLKLVLDEESAKRIEMEAKFQARLKSRLKEQRKEIENENLENIAKIEANQKQEIAALAGKISANKNAQVNTTKFGYKIAY